MDSGGDASHESYGPDFAFLSRGGDTGRLGQPEVIGNGDSSYSSSRDGANVMSPDGAIPIKLCRPACSTQIHNCVYEPCGNHRGPSPPLCLPPGLSASPTCLNVNAEATIFSFQKTAVIMRLRPFLLPFFSRLPFSTFVFVHLRRIRRHGQRTREVLHHSTSGISPQQNPHISVLFLRRGTLCFFMAPNVGEKA